MNTDFECLEASMAHAKASAVILKRCFPSFWPAEDIFKMLGSNNISGFFINKLICAPHMEKSPEISKTIHNNIDFAAMALYSCVIDELELLKICVLPEFRRGGLATKLMDKVLEQAKQDGVKKVFLEVAENNLVARKFYITCGFFEYGRRKDYYKHKNMRIDAIIYSKVFGLVE